MRPDVTNPFDRQAPCPGCGAPIVFRFAGAQAQVCRSCKALVARTDRSLVNMGRVADLVELPSPLTVGASGKWGNQRFEVEGRVQIDRASAPGAPWQEFFIGFPETGDFCWVAFAQGRWYSTREVTPTPALPPMSQLRPGAVVPIGSFGQFTIAEVGQRRVVSAEGELPSVAPPGVVTGYADFAGPNGSFGTLDYGDGQSLPPKLYLGRQFDPATIQLASGLPLEQPKADVTSCECPNCGGSLPLVAPGTAERIVCRYCGTASDIQPGGALQALGQAPRPPVEPYIPIGQEGNLRGNRVICIGFVIRGTTVEGERYRWREYLIYAGPTLGYAWLMEEDNKWQLVRPLSPGDVQNHGTSVAYGGQMYGLKQSVQAEVEYVVGEFYWKVEIGEAVQAAEYVGPGGKVSVETSQTEVNTSFCEEIQGSEVAQSFGLPPPPAPAYTPSVGGTSMANIMWIGGVIFLILILSAADCGGSGGGGGVYVGPGFGGK